MDNYDKVEQKDYRCKEKRERHCRVAFLLSDKKDKGEKNFEFKKKIY